MATQTNCIVCVKKKGSFACAGCSQYYCIKHLNEHEGNFKEQLSRLETQHDELRDSNKDLRDSPSKHPLMIEIEQWEMTSIDRIKQVANQCKESLSKYMKTSFHVSNAKLDSLAEWMKKLREDNDFNELDLNPIEQKLNQLRKEITQLSNFVLERQPTSFINFISLRIKSGEIQLLVFFLGENFAEKHEWHARQSRGCDFFFFFPFVQIHIVNKWE